MTSKSTPSFEKLCKYELNDEYAKQMDFDKAKINELKVWIKFDSKNQFDEFIIIPKSYIRVRGHSGGTAVFDKRKKSVIFNFPLHLSDKNRNALVRTAFYFFGDESKFTEEVEHDKEFKQISQKPFSEIHFVDEKGEILSKIRHKSYSEDRGSYKNNQAKRKEREHYGRMYKENLEELSKASDVCVQIVNRERRKKHLKTVTKRTLQKWSKEKI